MRHTEKDLKTSETDARDAQAALEHHDDSKRPRARGEHGASGTAPSARRQPRRRPAATRTGERRASTADPRLTPGATGSMTENSLDLFLRAARAHALLTAEEEVDLAQRIEKGDLAAKERMINSNLRLVVSQARRYQGHGLRWRTWFRRACSA